MIAPILVFQSVLSKYYVSNAYNYYEEKKYILELIKLYEKETTDYQDLVNKREKINDIMSKLTDCEFYPEIIFEINISKICFIIFLSNKRKYFKI